LVVATAAWFWIILSDATLRREKGFFDASELQPF